MSDHLHTVPLLSTFFNAIPDPPPTLARPPNGWLSVKFTLPSGFYTLLCTVVL